jgi:hypothetical protein
VKQSNQVVYFNYIFTKVTLTEPIMYTAEYKGTIVSVPKGQEKVFFSEGGKFDQDFKCFYFTDDDTPETFDHWLPENTVAIISEGFYIHEAPVICNRCNKRTSVISLASQSLYIKKEQNKKDERWDEGDCLYSFDHIRFIPFPTARLIQKVFPQWDYLLSPKRPIKYWSNKCQHCGTVQDEDFLARTVFGTFKHERPQMICHCHENNGYGFPIIARMSEVDLYGFDDGDGRYSFYRREHNGYAVGSLYQAKEGKWYEEDRFW